jgi:hypothetical protein
MFYYHQFLVEEHLALQQYQTIASSKLRALHRPWPSIYYKCNFTITFYISFKSDELWLRTNFYYTVSDASGFSSNEQNLFLLQGLLISCQYYHTECLFFSILTIFSWLYLYLGNFLNFYNNFNFNFILSVIFTNHYNKLQ